MPINRDPHSGPVADSANQTDALFSNGRLTSDVRYTKVDLETRCEVEGLSGASRQRVRRRRPAA